MNPTELVMDSADLLQKETAQKVYVRLQTNGACFITDEEGFPYGGKGMKYSDEQAEEVAGLLRDRGYEVVVLGKSDQVHESASLDSFRRLSGLAPSLVESVVTHQQMRHRQMQQTKPKKSGGGRKKRPVSPQVHGDVHTYKGKEGLWRTVAGDRVFYPSDGSEPMAAAGLGRALKKMFGKGASPDKIKDAGDKAKAHKAAKRAANDWHDSDEGRELHKLDVKKQYDGHKMSKAEKKRHGELNSKSKALRKAAKAAGDALKATESLFDPSTKAMLEAVSTRWGKYDMERWMKTFREKGYTKVSQLTSDEVRIFERSVLVNFGLRDRDPYKLKNGETVFLQTGAHIRRGLVVVEVTAEVSSDAYANMGEDAVQAALSKLLKSISKPFGRYAKVGLSDGWRKMRSMEIRAKFLDDVQGVWDARGELSHERLTKEAAKV
jgi:hypothetical protein